MDFKELKAYQKAFDLAMEVFMVTKCFLKEEHYALINQIRRSSRSVCSNLAEGYGKRRFTYENVLKNSVEVGKLLGHMIQNPLKFR